MSSRKARLRSSARHPSFPNVSVIGTRKVLTNVTRRWNASVALYRHPPGALSRLLVLAGEVSADSTAASNDAGDFKVCGATRRDILAAFAASFFAARPVRRGLTPWSAASAAGDFEGADEIRPSACTPGVAGAAAPWPAGNLPAACSDLDGLGQKPAALFA